MRVVDCRSEEGITIGLIDALLSIGRVLASRIAEADQQVLGFGVKDALTDLAQDEDLRYLLEEGGKARLKYGSEE